MPEITHVVFYFAVAQNGDVNLPPESHTLTWQEVEENVGFALNNGELMFTELPVSSNSHILRIVNGFYFGANKYGKLLAIQYQYDDGTDGWIDRIRAKKATSENLDMLIGNWIKGLTYQQIKNHERWRGEPYIGYENDYVEVEIKRIEPEPEEPEPEPIGDLILSLTPEFKEVFVDEEVTYTFSATNDCATPVAFQWGYDKINISEGDSSDNTKTFRFLKAGTYTIELRATNGCGQAAVKQATVVVMDVPKPPCDVSISPSQKIITLGEQATFIASHTQAGEGTWSHDATIHIIKRDSTSLTIQPSKKGIFTIYYVVGDCEVSAKLTVEEVPIDLQDPPEPEPPPLPDTPPEELDLSEDPWFLQNPTNSWHGLYAYPQVILRNARYRGQRESEKVLSSHQEQLFDIRQLYKEITSLHEETLSSIKEWFKTEENELISLNTKMQAQETGKFTGESTQTGKKEIGSLLDNMLKLANISISNEGIFSIKQRIQQIDERVAEVERRLQQYENAYK